MKSKNIYNLNIILISIILVLSKYIISYLLNYEEDLFFNKNLFKKDKSGQYNKPF